ncbi:helix-turn-helix transcriptional regulator [Spirillospora sp. NPDC049652]
MTASKEPYEGRAIRAFAGDLTAWRVQRGLNKVELAERLGYDASLIGQLEACRNIPSQKFAEDCDTFFSCAGSFARRWEEIEEERDLHLLPPGFPEFLKREAQASVMHLFEPTMITGLFQTPEYAYEIMKVSYGPAEAKKLVETRMSRSEILVRKKPPKIIAVFDEMAIRRCVGGAGVMRGQYERLMEIGEMYNVSLQVVPFSEGAYLGLLGAFSVLEFEGRPDLVYTEDYAGGFFTGTKTTVQEYRVSFDMIRGAAKSTTGTLSFLHEALEAL